MSSSKKKWYAYYEGSAIFDLMSGEEREAYLEELLEDKEKNGDKITHLKYAYNEFNSLRDAKKYLMMHLKGDLEEIKGSIKDLKKRRAQ
jgi:hypothetical protein